VAASVKAAAVQFEIMLIQVIVALEKAKKLRLFFISFAQLK
jgi:hypothetical protein